MREPSSERLYQLIRRRRGERQKELVLESGVEILRSKLTTIGKIQFLETDRPQPSPTKIEGLCLCQHALVRLSR
jgi:hypothetical protein